MFEAPLKGFEGGPEENLTATEWEELKFQKINLFCAKLLERDFLNAQFAFAWYINFLTWKPDSKAWYILIAFYAAR